MVLGRERQQIILELLESQQAVQVAELAERFGVSEVTIRRDLNELMRRYDVERVYGGAVLTQREIMQPPIDKREVLHLEEKRRIGWAAAELVEDGDTIIVGGGTTTAEMARHLGDRRDVMVITSALNVANILANNPRITLLVTGGLVVGPEVTLAGYYGEQTMRALHAEKLFLGAGAFDLDMGLTSAHPSEIGMNRAMIEAARERILLIDHSKFNQVATCSVGRTSELDCIVTGQEVPDDTASRLEEMGIRIVRA